MYLWWCRNLSVSSIAVPKTEHQTHGLAAAFAADYLLLVGSSRCNTTVQRDWVSVGISKFALIRSRIDILCKPGAFGISGGLTDWYFIRACTSNSFHETAA